MEATDIKVDRKSTVSGGLKMYPNRRFENAAEKRFLKAVIGINFGGQWLLCI